MAGPILVTGATGKLGPVITRALVGRGEKVRVFTRRPEAAAALFGPAVEIAVGDLDDRATLDRAVAGVERVLLLSPIDARLAEHQIAAIDAAEAAGVHRFVKISGSDWTFGPDGTFSGHAHQKIENRLASGSVPWVSLRPNAWTQVSLTRLADAALRGDDLFAPYGEATVSYIDVRDIADVAVHQLLAPEIEPGVRVITGGQSLSIRDIARIAGALLDRDVGVTTVPPPPAPDGHGNAFEAGIVNQFLALLKAGRASGISPVVPELLGRPARTVEAFLAEQFAAATARAA